MVGSGSVAAGVRGARRWLRRTLLRVSPSKREVTVHLPDFSGSRLHVALMADDNATAEKPGDRPLDGDHARSDILARARERFGPRFFVCPDRVPLLWQRLCDAYPEWRNRQREAVRSDVENGIPIYSWRGPPVGIDFPWHELPVGPGDDGIYAKRPHRFAFAPRHALACHDDPEAADRLRGMLEGWMDRARTGADPYCYDSNLGVIQRLLALSWAWAFLAGRGTDGGAEEQALEWTVLRIIEADIRFLESRIGHSAPNNHLLADRFVAWYLRALFPELLAAKSDGNEESRWREELLRQTYPDGGSFEQSAHYHEFACEMGCAYLLLCRRQGQPPDPAIEARVSELLRFQAVLTGPEAVPLPFGNAIEDTLFPLDPAEGWCTGSLRELYRALFRPELEPTPSDNPSWIRAFWLLGGSLVNRPVDAAKLSAMESFPDSGFHVMTDVDPDARLIFRTGPAPEVPVVPGHMHADLLAIYLSVTGCPVVVDAGTYTYRSKGVGWDTDAPPWRQYFAGPRAHNGLTVGNRDPLGDLGSDFRRSGEEVRAVATKHDSRHLAMVDARLISGDPYRNARRIVIHVRGEYWLVVDVPPESALSSDSVSYGFQFDAGTRIARTASGLEIEHPESAATMHMAVGGKLDTPVIYEGETDPLAGWISPRYGELRPAPQARFITSRPRGPVAFLFQIGAQTYVPDTVNISHDESGAFRVIASCETREDIVLSGCGDTCNDSVCGHPITFRGDLMWLRAVTGMPREMRWLGAQKLSWSAWSIDSESLDADGMRRFP